MMTGPTSVGTVTSVGGNHYSRANPRHQEPPAERTTALISNDWHTVMEIVMEITYLLHSA